MRDKRAVQKLINLENPQPFVYSCGRYSSENNKTSVAFPIAPAKNGNVLVFDLRYNLDDLLKEKAELAKTDPAKSESFYPIVKELKYNHCPAVAPLGVLKQGNSWQQINLDETTVQKNLTALLAHPEFAERMRTQNENREEFPPAADAESALYDGFIDNLDKKTCDAVRNADIKEISAFHPNFHDERLAKMFVNYKARNFEQTLSDSERASWEEYRLGRIRARQNSYIKAIQEIAASPNADPYILEELQLWYQSLLPY
jgi:exodeoxyribonuclease-1